MNPYQPIPRFVRERDHTGLIRRLLRPDVDLEVSRIDLITTTRSRLSVIDSGTKPESQIAEGDTAVHILWQADEEAAFLDVGGFQEPIRPGDTAWIPTGDDWHLSANQLAVLVATRSNSLGVPILPTHGIEHFSGHNRESTYPGGNLRIHLSRWKLTEPLTLPAEQKTDVIVLGLYGDLAIQYSAGVSTLRQGEASVIRPETGNITLVPNGLSYVLVIVIDQRM